MPKEINYIQCDCEKGKLEEIAETQMRYAGHAHQGKYSTLFYACDSCDKIFTREKLILIGMPSSKSFHHFELYKGLLGREDIKKYAPKYETLDRKAEEKILAEKAKGIETKLEKRY